MTKKANTPRSASMEPTSDLPFAARHCDLPYLDLIKNHRHNLCGKAELSAGPDQAGSVDFAIIFSCLVERVDQIGGVLASAETSLEFSARGGRPGGMSAVAEFQHAMQLIGMCRQLIEDAVPLADENLEAFCTTLASPKT